MAISISVLPEVLRPKEVKVEEAPEWAKKYVYVTTQGLANKCYVSAIDPILDERELTTTKGIDWYIQKFKINNHQSL
jgi:hypothetical protein